MPFVLIVFALRIEYEINGSLKFCYAMRCESAVNPFNNIYFFNKNDKQIGVTSFDLLTRFKLKLNEMRIVFNFFIFRERDDCNQFKLILFFGGKKGK